MILTTQINIDQLPAHVRLAFYAIQNHHEGMSVVDLCHFYRWDHVQSAQKAIQLLRLMGLIVCCGTKPNGRNTIRKWRMASLGPPAYEDRNRENLQGQVLLAIKKHANGVTARTLHAQFPDYEFESIRSALWRLARANQVVSPYTIKECTGGPPSKVWFVSSAIVFRG